MAQKSNVSAETIAINTPATNSEVKKMSFWISQLFILAATVLGVYLAATQGFKQAVQFENIMSQKSVYYLQKSLKSEVSNNVLATEEFLNKAKNSQDQWAVYPLELSYFIWNNMLESPTSLELSPTILANSEKFMNGLKKGYEKATTGAQDQRQAGIKTLEKLVDLAKGSLIPELDKNIDSLESNLKKLDIQL